MCQPIAKSHICIKKCEEKNVNSYFKYKNSVERRWNNNISEQNKSKIKH